MRRRAAVALALAMMFYAAIGVAESPSLRVAPVAGGVLVTLDYVVVVVNQCAEGDVDCANVVYTGVDRKTGAAVTIHGKSLVAMCADGTTPCRHLGWTFTKDGVTYTVSDAGVLDVTRKNDLILEQKGRWVEP